MKHNNQQILSFCNKIVAVFSVFQKKQYFIELYIVNNAHTLQILSCFIRLYTNFGQTKFRTKESPETVDGFGVLNPIRDESSL